MKKHELLEAVIKLIGVYCFILFLRVISNFPILVVFFLQDFSSSFSISTTHLFVNMAYPLVLILLSYVFVKRTDMILKLLDLSTQQNEEENTIKVSTCGHLSFWIRIIGLYFFVSSTPYIASHFIVSILSLDLSTTQQMHVISDSGHYILAQVFMLGLSLFFIFKNQYIEALLTQTKSEEKQFRSYSRGSINLYY